MPDSANFFGHALDPGRGQWHWVFSPESKFESPSFDSRLDAQAWLGQKLPELRTASLTSAHLAHRGNPIGTPIKLQ